MHETGPIGLVIREGVAIVTLDRGQRGNLIDAEMAAALLDVAVTCETAADIRCVLLTGSGRLFCGGGDIEAFARAGADAARIVSEQAGIYHAAITRLARMEKPLVVAVNGPAAGAGLGLAIMGDIVIAADVAHFTFGYTALGFTPDGATSWFLPRVVGLRLAQEMAMTNRRVEAAEAQAIGMVTSVVPSDQLEAAAWRQALALAQGPTSALGQTRDLLLSSLDADLDTHLRREARFIAEASASPDGREGIHAFLERRPPRFGK